MPFLNRNLLLQRLKSIAGLILLQLACLPTGRVKTLSTSIDFIIRKSYIAIRHS